MLLFRIFHDSIGIPIIILIIYCKDPILKLTLHGSTRNFSCQEEENCTLFIKLYTCINKIKAK